MPVRWQPPFFSTEPWYSDPTDHRCPRDASLESLEITGPKESRGSEGLALIKLTLTVAHHHGWIILRYSGVRNHSLPAYSCDQGSGNWLRDEFNVSSAGLTSHRITWNCPASGVSQWLIEAAKVVYEWKPRAGLTFSKTNIPKIGRTNVER